MIRLLLLIVLMMMPVNVFAMGSVPNSNRQTTGIAPDFILKRTDDQTLSLTQARNGKKAILIFWATWCPHCHEELERVRQNLESIKAKGIEVVLVDIGETKEEVKSYLSNQGIALESFLDEENSVAGQYNVQGVPSVFLIDEKGIVRNMSYGFPADYESQLSSQ